MLTIILRNGALIVLEWAKRSEEQDNCLLVFASGSKASDAVFHLDAIAGYTWHTGGVVVKPAQ